MMLLGGAYLVLFTRYTIATFLSSFFPQLAADRFQITDTYNGLIFAAYPLGMSITSIFAPQAIACMGTRTATGLGLAATTLLTVLFGVAPDLCGMPNLQYVFLVSYFLSGLLGALAETACIILVSATFKANPAAVMASINTVCTVGCMLGPPVGGVIFELGRKIDEGWAFRMPFLVCAVIPLLLVPLLPAFMPQRHIGDGSAAIEGDGDADAAVLAPPPPPHDAPHDTPHDAPHDTPHDAPQGAPQVYPCEHPCEIGHAQERGATKPPGLTRWVLLSPSIVLGLASIALSGGLVGTLDPTLSIRLSAAPFKFSAATISLFFTYSSIVYACVSTPCGWLIDKFPNSPRLYKGITTSGFLALGATFALLAPFGTAAFGHSGTHTDAFQGALNNVPCVAMAMVLKGVGSALSNCAIYPDLIIGVPEGEELLHATISALWNSAYAIGWAAGPFLGDVLMDAMEGHLLCVDQMAMPPNCPAESPSPAFPPPPPSLAPVPIVIGDTHNGRALVGHETSLMIAAPSNCSCEWVPDNGFDGFGSVTALLALAYCVPLALAAALNCKGPNRRFMPQRPLGAGALWTSDLAPLDAMATPPRARPPDAADGMM